MKEHEDKGRKGIQRD